MKRSLTLFTLALVCISISTQTAFAQRIGTKTFAKIYEEATKIDLYEFQNFANETTVCFASEISSDPIYNGTGVCLNTTYSPLVKASGNLYTNPDGLISVAKGAYLDFTSWRPGVAEIVEDDFTFESGIRNTRTQSALIKIRRLTKASSSTSYIMKKIPCRISEGQNFCNSKKASYGVFKAVPVKITEI